MSSQGTGAASVPISVPVVSQAAAAPPARAAPAQEAAAPGAAAESRRETEQKIIKAYCQKVRRPASARGRAH